MHETATPERRSALRERLEATYPEMVGDPRMEAFIADQELIEEQTGALHQLVGEPAACPPGCTLEPGHGWDGLNAAGTAVWRLHVFYDDANGVSVTQEESKSGPDEVTWQRATLWLDSDLDGHYTLAEARALADSITAAAEVLARYGGAR